MFETYMTVGWNIRNGLNLIAPTPHHALETPKWNCSFSMGTCYLALTEKEEDY